MKAEKETAMTKVERMTNQLDEVANDILKGRIKLSRAKEFCNAAGKIASLIKVQQAQQALFLAFEALGKKLPPIDYLGNQKRLPK